MARLQARPDLPLWVGFGVYTLACFLLFTWIRFPYDALRPRMENALARNLGLEVSLGHVRPSLTGGLVVEGVRMHENPVAKKVSISPRPWEAFRGVVGLGFRAELASGSLEGRARIPYRKGSRPLDVVLDMREMDLAAFGEVFPPATRPKGSVSGEIRLAAVGGAIDRSAGSVNLSWKKGSIPLNMPSLPFDALVFETLDLEGGIQGGQLTLDRGEFTGEFSGTFTGSVRLGKDARRTRLNITGEINIPDSVRASLGPAAPPPGQAAKFSLRGSVEKPRFRFMGGNAARPDRIDAASRRREALLNLRQQRALREQAEPVTPPPAQAGQPEATPQDRALAPQTPEGSEYPADLEEE